MQCEMCGKDVKLIRASIEGTEMNVCEQCASFGERVAVAAKPKAIPVRKPKVQQERQEIVVDDCAALVKAAREKRGLKQEELAKRIQEKESVIQNVETGKFTPSIALARKLESYLNITLVEDYVETIKVPKASGGEGLTLGDMIKL